MSQVIPIKGINHADRGHATLSASGSSRWMVCPGSVREEAKHPKQESSAAAQWGTDCHELSERILRVHLGGNDGPDAEECALFIQQLVEQYGETDAAEIRETADQYVNYVLNIEADTGGLLLVEHQFDLSWLHPDMFGTNDAICISDDCLHVIDLKGGKGILVEAERNTQLLYYALGAHHDFGFLYGYSKVRLHIVQPRKYNYDSWELSVSELEQWAGELKAAAVATEDPNAPLVPGDKQCTFCRAKVDCPQLIGMAQRIAADEFEAEPELDPADPQMPLDKLLQLAETIEPWVKAVKNRVKSALLSGEHVAGYKVVAGRSTRVWTDVNWAADRLKDVPGAFSVPELKSVAQVEKALKAVGHKPTAVKVLLEDLVGKQAGKPTIAPESDKRPAIDPAELASADFTEEGSDE